MQSHQKPETDDEYYCSEIFTENNNKPEESLFSKAITIEIYFMINTTEIFRWNNIFFDRHNRENLERTIHKTPLKHNIQIRIRPVGPCSDGGKSLPVWHLYRDRKFCLFEIENK